MRPATLLRALRMPLVCLAITAGVPPCACAAPPVPPGIQPASAPLAQPASALLAQPASAPLAQPAPAAQPASAPAAPLAAQQESREKAAIRAVIADPVFGGKKEDFDWRYNGDLSDPSDKKAESPSWLQPLLDAIEFVSRALRVMVWIGLALIIAAVIYFAYRYRDAWIGPLRGRAAPPEFLFGLDVRPGSLPDDVVAAALQELARGNAAAALSLLYRGALVSLIHRSQIDFHAGHTEGDCLRLVRAAVDTGSSGYFGELLEAWKRTAYGHEPPPAAALESLCARWRTHFAQVEAQR